MCLLKQIKMDKRVRMKPEMHNSRGSYNSKGPLHLYDHGAFLLQQGWITLMDFLKLWIFYPTIYEFKKHLKQRRKRPLYTPKRKIERREREKEKIKLGSFRQRASPKKVILQEMVTYSISLQEMVTILSY